MSLAIDMARVTSVLLGGEWIAVIAESFDIDSYEFMDDRFGLGDPRSVRHGGGASGICASGFYFESSNGFVYGPLTSIQAVRCGELPNPEEADGE